MKLSELKTVLAQCPAARVRFRLPDGGFIPAHAHVTEVARVDKRFIDCGGTLRKESLCRLQTWIADDVEHRLTAGKLNRILNLATGLLLTEDLDVDIEHEAGCVTQFPLDGVEVIHQEVVLRLTQRHTACLAPEKCLPPGRAEVQVQPAKI